jgi:DNA-binding NarL/FixJ family response regulator
MSGRKTRILLADDHELVRAGLRALLRGRPDMEVVAEAADGRTAVRLAGELAVGVVVMDVNMPGLNGIEATRQLAAAGGPPVVVLSAHADARAAREALRAGARGYVRKDQAVDELVYAVAAAAEGRVHVSPAFAAAVADELGVGAAGVGAAAGVAARSAFEVLSGREREVLQLIAEGRPTKRIALELAISVKTVETHRKSLMDKLALNSLAELTRYAIREGVSSLRG